MGKSTINGHFQQLDTLKNSRYCQILIVHRKVETYISHRYCQFLHLLLDTVSHYQRLHLNGHGPRSRTVSESNRPPWISSNRWDIGSARVQYPLVMSKQPWKITIYSGKPMENHHLQWQNYGKTPQKQWIFPLNMVIFHSYVANYQRVCRVNSRPDNFPRSDSNYVCL